MECEIRMWLLILEMILQFSQWVMASEFKHIL